MDTLIMGIQPLAMGMLEDQQRWLHLHCKKELQ
jgi:hypothetical protein